MVSRFIYRSCGLPCALLVICVAASCFASSFYDRHVVFDTSYSDRSFYRSEGSAVAPSELEIIDAKFPVETNHFHSAPNALRLKWKSAAGGDWRMKLKSVTRYGRDLAFEGDTLCFWCYSESDISPEQSPQIALQDTAGIGSANYSLLADCGFLPAHKWVRVNIPFEHFKPLFGRTD